MGQSAKDVVEQECVQGLEKDLVLIMHHRGGGGKEGMLVHLLAALM